MTAPVLLAAIGAAVVGALLRWVVVGRADRASDPRGYSRGLLLVNGFGSLVAGIVLGATVRFGLDPMWTAVIVTGFAGGLTTFSTWAVRTTAHAMAARWGSSVIDAVGTLAVGLGGAALGFFGIAYG